MLQKIEMSEKTRQMIFFEKNIDNEVRKNVFHAC
jgi:hypothetical protein